MAMIKRVGAPTRTTVGAIGDTYIDLKTRKAYICTSAYHSSNGSVDYAWRATDVTEEIPEEPQVIEEPVEEEKESETVVEAVEEEVIEEPKEEPAVEETRKPNKYNYNKQFKRQ